MFEFEDCDIHFSSGESVLPDVRCLTAVRCKMEDVRCHEMGDVPQGSFSPASGIHLRRWEMGDGNALFRSSGAN